MIDSVLRCRESDTLVNLYDRGMLTVRSDSLTKGACTWMIRCSRGDHDELNPWAAVLLVLCAPKRVFHLVVHPLSLDAAVG
jgi:hypothetical protein